ncbi:S8 family serine peptidase [Polaribacter pectinis]|uniref:S8 family serine peptidase n=1 Tax=Polaribacter pectinis TaxID=2738844 RepID=A0A7G9L8Q9_9FLAO|nr:S8 family serine peptidase [Polaribacter pectinis]QNM85008.1 S8 family serine peptidase [Polaribacter pectinis]
MNYKYLKISLLFLLFISVSITAQTPKEKQDITREYDLSKLKNLKEKFQKKFSEEKNRAILLATQRGWKIKYTENGTYYELMRISEEGKPLYYKTDNVDAAVSTRANFLHKDGGLGLDLEGQGMTAYVWDGGLARTTHQEYDGDGGENRFSIGDGTTELNFHAAHVMGTIISSGFEPAAKGMAPKAKGIGNDWDNDIAETTAAAAEGMLLSNHSYGFNADNIPDWTFGAYGEAAREWDEVMYNAPYYLTVFSAGNDGGNNSANAEPLEGNSSFDKINTNKTSKNSMVVANGQDATINADGTLSNVVRNSGSSEGPMDDLRIKPDIMGNGTGLYSSYESSDDAYSTITGTSMAAPNVTGSLLLLQQHHKESYGNFMRAATLKGLALHTADDTDIAGPDPHTGWGLMNTKVAAETITKNGFESWISEEVLSNGGTYSITVKSDGFNPLLASISWTDKPGEISDGTANNPKAALVNDLDIRVTQGSNEYKPWRLTGVYSNEKGDNLVDPYERVDIDNPSGEYTITVTHKGTLAEDQRFSLIVTGISGEFTFLADSSEKGLCSENDAVFNFEYRQAVAGTTDFTLSGVPAGMTTAFSNQSLSANGNFTITFGNLENVPAGPYDIEVIGDNGNETQKRTIRLTVYHPSFSDNPSELEYPANGEKGISFTKIELRWKNNLNANNYKVEVSDSPSFTNIAYTGDVKSTTFGIEGLQSGTVYYWRIKPKNDCGIGEFSSIFSFQTGSEDCTNVYSATDFTNASAMPFTTNQTFYVPIEVTDDLLINDIKVTVDITHSEVQDLTLVVKEPIANGTKQATLLSKVCDDTDDISNVTFDDDAAELVCGSEKPAVSGMVKPEQPLKGFGGLMSKGTWLFEVNDFDLFDGGQINSASITICASVEITSIPSLTSSIIKLDANSTYTITNANMEATSASETAEQQIFTLVEQPIKGQLQREGITLNAGDTFTQADISSNKITFVNSQSTSFADQFRVDVTNAANGWLANQIIIIEEKTLTINEFSLDNVSFWPNPTKDVLNIKLNNATSDNVVITLFDLQGRKVITTLDKPSNLIFTKEINTKNVSSGVYLLSISQGNKKATKKIIITK